MLLRKLIPIVGFVAPLSAQLPTPPVSIGQPSLWEQEASAVVPLRAGYGVHRSLINPVIGLAGLTGEFYGDVSRRTPGTRLLLESKVIGLSAGLDWSFRKGGIGPAFGFETAVRRGGLLGRGSLLRIEWLPGKDQPFALGMSVPMFRPLAGRTRPLRTHIRLGDQQQVPRSARDDIKIGEIASLIGAFGNAYSDRAERLVQTHAGRYSVLLNEYDTQLDRAFSSATGDSGAARRVMRRGRDILLRRVLLPFDSLFGQAKEDEGRLEPLTAAAFAEFSRWLADSLRLDAPRRRAAEEVFAGWMIAVDDVRADLLRDAGGDTRLVWLPLDLALTSDEFDEQSEVDSLIARAVGRPFSDQNALTYLRSTDLPVEIARSIYAAKSYHVLWTHDFTGRRESGAIDNIGFSMVADAYLPALTAAVRRYDSTGALPTYIILQDEFFYEPRDNRLWMNVLEDPLHASPRLRGDTAGRENLLRKRLTELRDAVAHSVRLQREAQASGEGERWLRRMVRVHVNIVEPSDFSFRSSHIIPGLSFTPDNIMREHRKIVFYDVNEADPYRGALLIMGVGIGEHYASATWEDRGYRVRGPAALEARRSVREALLRNGLREMDIPAPLRPVTDAPSAERRSNNGDYVGRALQVHNEVGFGRKESSVARAMLYNLAPPGSVIIVPDPMWLSDTWAGMLAAAAARGCRVYVIAPGEANAPSPQGPLIALEHDVLARLLELRRSLSAQIGASGGELRVGIFAAQAPTNDGAGRRREVRDGLARAPWIRQLVPFDARTLAVLERADSTTANTENSTALARDEKARAPQLHQKSQLIARPGAIQALVRQPGWDATLAQVIRVQARETAKFAEQLGFTTPDVDTTATRSTDALLRGYERTIPEAERRRVSFYFSLGTQNQDPRGIVSDGEASLLVSGVQASAGLADLYFLMARSTWVESESELSRFVPPKSGFIRRLAHFFKAAF